MAYEKKFVNPYPDGWIDLPEEETPVDAEAMQKITDGIEGIDNYLSENPPDELKESLIQFKDDGFLPKNLFNPSNVLNANISTEPSITSSDRTRLVYAKCEPNKTYTVSKMVGARFQVAYTKALPSVGVNFFGKITQNSASSITITTGADAEYIVAFVYSSSSGDSMSAETMIASVQIEEGTEAHSYTPYAMSNQGLTQIVEDAIDNEYIGINLYDGKVASYCASGWGGSTASIVSVNGGVAQFECEPNTTYTISKKASDRFRACDCPSLSTSATAKILGQNDSATSLTVRTSSDAKYLLVYVDSSQSKNLDSLNIQIERGSEVHSYHPYIPSNSELKQSLAQLENVEDGSFLSASGTINTGNTTLKASGNFVVLGLQETGVTANANAWTTIATVSSEVKPRANTQGIALCGSSVQRVQINTIGQIQIYPTVALSSAQIILNMSWIR